MNLIEEALEALREHGWTKFTQRDMHTGKVCALGALAVARNGFGGEFESWESDEAQQLERTARALFPERCCEWETIAWFNNHENTTQEDIELVFKHAAHEWDLQHDGTHRS